MTTAPAVNQGTREATARLEDMLFADPDLCVYAVIDGARMQGTPGFLAGVGAEFVCLFKGALEPPVAEMAPYLVTLSRGGPAWTRLMRGWGNSEAIFLRSRLAMLPLRKHFRRLTMVKMEDEKVVFFRFYDPRVLRIVVPTFDDKQRAFFFGDAVLSYYCEDEGGAGPLQFDPSGAVSGARAPTPA